MAGLLLEDKITVQAALVDMVTTDPDVVSCIDRVGNALLLNDVTVLENGKPLRPALARVVNEAYKKFFRDALAMSYMCGFVAYHLVRHEGMRIPQCLPLGMFSWSVRAAGRGTSGALAHYDVRLTHGRNVTVHVFEMRSPVLQQSLDASRVCSPLMGVFTQFVHWKDAETQFSVSNQWNTSKHVAITERLDLKDQTTSGIQLLDEQRRYNLTGHHNNVVHNSLMRLTGAGTTTSVADAFQHHVHSEFSDREPSGVGSKRAVVHILPPNTEVQELGLMDVGTAVRDSKAAFQSAVYIFFGMPNINNTNTTTSATTEINSLHREQYAHIMNTQRHMEGLGAEVYARCFGLEPGEVVCSLRALPRFELTSVADIKVLSEINMLTPSDVQQLRKMMLNR